MGGISSNSIIQQGLFDSVVERHKFGSSNLHSFGSDFNRANFSFNENQPRLFRSQDPWQTHARRSSMELNFIKEHQDRGRDDQEKKAQKRKVSDSDCNLDLNLSLKTVTPENGRAQKNVDDDDEVNTSSLSLSLFSSSTSNCTSRLEKCDNGGKKHARTMASTLDLTL